MPLGAFELAEPRSVGAPRVAGAIGAADAWAPDLSREVLLTATQRPNVELPLAARALVALEENLVAVVDELIVLRLGMVGGSAINVVRVRQNRRLDVKLETHPAPPSRQHPATVVVRVGIGRPVLHTVAIGGKAETLLFLGTSPTKLHSVVIV
jgi:hypothetical protein